MKYLFFALNFTPDKICEKYQIWTRPASDTHARFEAGPGEVDHGAAQHVPVFGGEHQRQVGLAWCEERGLFGLTFPFGEVNLIFSFVIL